jgi:hypothetical protein
MPPLPSLEKALKFAKPLFNRELSMLQHYIVIKYQNATSDEHIAEFCRRMLDLRTSIAGIEHLEIGRDILHDARSWDLILMMRFVSW